jgi:hypothetical protein
LRRKILFASSEEEAAGAINAEALEELEKGYIDLEKEEAAHAAQEDGESDSNAERVVDVVLSDMCEPWEQTTGFWKRSLTDPYLRMMNTSGNNFRDHAGSMVGFLLRNIERSRMLMCHKIGPLSSGARVQLRDSEDWRGFCVQVLPGLGGQIAREGPEGHVSQGPQGEA